jgi:hypothetical protein
MIFIEVFGGTVKVKRLLCVHFRAKKASAMPAFMHSHDPVARWWGNISDADV